MLASMMRKLKIEHWTMGSEDEKTYMHGPSPQLFCRAVELKPPLTSIGTTRRLSTLSMSKSSISRLLRALQSPTCASCRLGPTTRPSLATRPFSSSTHILAKASSSGDPLDSMLTAVGGSFQRRTSPSSFGSIIPPKGELDSFTNIAPKEWQEEERHYLHVYAHKHNTHITLTKPNHEALISVSCGNIGFRKAGRGSYDAAYQLAAFVMSRIQDKGLLPQIQKIEVVYRGFGAGREAVTKAILGSEGRRIRPLVTKLSDSTRLKFGGVRSKKPRRLG
jgi:small subunit ribosomal protein S11